MTDQSEDMRGRDLRDADLSGVDFVDTDLREADLRGADLSGASLVDADLRDADLTGADLTGANLTDADLRGADLTDTALSGANLTDADLRGPDPTGSHSPTSLSSVVGTVVTGATLIVAFALLAAGWSAFWVVFIIGFAGVLPVATKLASWYESRKAEENGDRTADEQAIARLRERYATGEIDEDEFERRVERLLETESLDDAERFHRRSGAVREGEPDSREPERELERN